MAVNQKNYQELIGLVELCGVVVVQMSFSRGKDYGQNIPAVKIEVSRGIAEPEIAGDSVCLPVGYRIRVGKGKLNVFKMQVVFHLSFRTLNATRLVELLNNNELKEFFTGYQADKIAWSYLRCHFSQACSSIGMKPLTLPLLR